MTAANKYSSENIYQVIGNKKKITQDSNYGKLQVIGNQCKIIMKKNYGCVEVIGDNCVVNIAENYGNVMCIGNAFILKISISQSLNSVSCIGNDCKVYIEQMDVANLNKFYQVDNFYTFNGDIFNKHIVDHIMKART